MLKQLTKTEARVLQTMRWADELDREQHALDWPGEPQPTGFARGVQGITKDVGILCSGRKPGELQVHEALQKLVARGLVRKNQFFGFTTTYTRSES